MGLFDKLFGGRRNREVIALESTPAAAPVQKPAVATSVPAPTAASAPATIRVFDQYGRPQDILRSDWLASVLLPALERDKGNPDGLYQTLLQGLSDGFASEMLPFAEHLAATDNDPVRGAVLHGATLLQLERFAAARSVLEAARSKHPDDGYLETNLAKALAGLGLQEEAERTLWHALTLDPNQENALGWFAAIHHERAGEAGRHAAHERVAALPASWRAQLWLARDALGTKNSSLAIALQEAVLARFAVVPTDVLMQVSGDLGQAGELEQALRLCQPRFDATVHGLQVGNNLIKACLDTGRIAQAREILERLHVQQRPDWKDSLVYWEKELDQAAGRFGPVPDDAAIELELITLNEPVWTRSDLGFGALLPVEGSWGAAPGGAVWQWRQDRGQ